MKVLNESALRDMMFQIVKETRPSLEEDVNANVDEVVKEIGLCKPNF